MSGLMYYLAGTPGVAVNKNLNHEDLKQFGIGYAFEGFPITVIPCDKGPSGGAALPGAPVPGAPVPGDTRVGLPGVVVVADGTFKENKPGYYPEQQRWMKIPAVCLEKLPPTNGTKTDVAPPPEIWVGVYTDAPPTPSGLQRKQRLNGHPVTLADGQEYDIPIARKMSETEGRLTPYVGLPMATTVNEQTGEWEPVGVMQQYQKLWDLAVEYWDEFTRANDDQLEENAGVEKPEVKFDFKKSYDAALIALSTNYRVRKIEIALLGLFTDAGVQDILMALIDWHTITEWIKKKPNPPPIDG